MANSSRVLPSLSAAISQVGLRPRPDQTAASSCGLRYFGTGFNFGRLTDATVLDLFNDVIEAQQAMAAEYDDKLIEIPPGKPQIHYSEQSNQWVPRGDVLRCYIEDDEAGELVVHVDDQELNLRDFGRMLRTFAGWGMRISFVPEDRIEDQPEVVIREPKDRGL